MLNLIKPFIRAKRRQEQMGFAPRRSTVDRILTLGILTKTRREYHQPLYASCVDLKAAFDAVVRGVLWKLMRAIGLLPKITSIIKSLYPNTVGAASGKC